jgi:hypothetical protein
MTAGAVTPAATAYPGPFFGPFRLADNRYFASLAVWQVGVMSATDATDESGPAVEKCRLPLVGFQVTSTGARHPQSGDFGQARAATAEFPNLQTLLILLWGFGELIPDV